MDSKKTSVPLLDFADFQESLNSGKVIICLVWFDLFVGIPVLYTVQIADPWPCHNVSLLKPWVYKNATTLMSQSNL
jgi:hypothetical protein